MLGANPPNHVMTGYLNRIWHSRGIDKIIQVKKGVFLVRFQTDQQYEEVMQNSMIHFDEKPLIVLPWTPDLTSNKADIQSVAVWV